MANEYCIIELQRYTFHLLATFTKRENVQAGTKGRPDEDESCFGKHHELISLFGLLFQLLDFGNTATGMRLKAVMSQVQKQNNN